MKNKWYQTDFAKQVFVGISILTIWAIITFVYSAFTKIDFWVSTTYIWNTLNFNVGFGWLILVFIIYTLIIRFFFLRLKKEYLTKEEVSERLSEKVNCASCDSSWEVLFAQISPYHPMHNYYTSDEYYLNRFRNLIWFGLRKKPSPDYYDIENGIDGLIEVIKHKQYISDTERDEILETLSECDDTKIKSKKEKLVELIDLYHK